MDAWNSNNRSFRSELNRSFSAPNINNIPYDFSNSNISTTEDHPLIRRVIVAEEVHHKNGSSPKIFRHYSYQELRSPNPFPKDSPLVQQFSNISFTDNLSSNFNNSRKMLTSGLADDYEEPMELDVSANSSHSNRSFDKIDKLYKQSIEYDTKYEFVDEVKQENNLYPRLPAEETKVKPTETKSMLQRPIIKKKKQIPFSIRLTMIGVILALLAVFLSYVIFDFNAEIDIEHLKTELTQKIYEQKDAVHSVVNSLRYQHDQGYWYRRVKVLNFVGRSGVGKTLIANIIKEHFHLKLVNDLYGNWMRNSQAKNSVLNKLYSDYLNLIVIDDLNVAHLEDVISFIKLIDDDDKSDKVVLIIAIFNIQKADNKLNYFVEYEDISKIHKAFDKTTIYHEIIVFDEFNDDDARNWLRKQLDSYEINREHHAVIERNIFNEIEVQNHGFKKLHSKLMREIQQVNSTKVNNVIE